MFSLRSLFALLVVLSMGLTNLAYAEQPASKENISTAKTQTKEDKQPVNINTADVQTLQNLKGIGTKKAQAIIDYRNQHGEFKTVHDLTGVKGISEKFLSKLQKDNMDMIVVK